jgi:hypothetical protein
MSLNQPLLLSSALVHQVLLSPTTYPYKQVSSSNRGGAQTFKILRQEIPSPGVFIAEREHGGSPSLRMSPRSPG